MGAVVGYYRLFLAYIVALSHIQFAIGAFNPGEVAVVSFFLLSGYVMTGLIDKHYGEFRLVGRFYLDRALRLYPQFLLYCVATIIAADRFGLRHAWMPCPPSIASSLAQLTMLPLTLQERFHDLLMPQSWSLSLEMMFYFIFPFVLLSGKRLAVALWSATIFMFGFFGALSADWFSYRLPPGVLFIFILGSWIYRSERERGRTILIAAFLFAAALLASALFLYPRRPVVCDVLIGLVVGLPVLLALSKARDLGPGDRLAGDLSYGVFLNHYLILAALKQVTPNASAAALILMTLPISTLLSFASFQWVERPIVGLRRWIRPKPGARAAAAPPRLEGAQAPA